MARSLEELKKQYAREVKERRRMMGPGPRGPRGQGPKGKPKNTLNVVRRMLSYVSEYKLRLIAVACFMLTSAGTSLAGATLLRPIINNIAKADTGAKERLIYLGVMLLVLGAVYLVGIAAHYLQARFMLYVSQNAT